MKRTLRAMAAVVNAVSAAKRQTISGGGSTGLPRADARITFSADDQGSSWLFE